MAKQVIAVDIDDVLSATAEGFTRYSNEQWGNTHKAENYSEAWADFWNVSIDEAMKRSDIYHASGVIGEFEHYAEALPVLRGLAKKYTLVVITSRKKAIKELTDAWLERHFPGVFSAVHYAGIWDIKEGEERAIERRLSQTKTELARELGASYLIDDQLKHCAGAADAGIAALLFGGRHRTVDRSVLPAGITFVQDWQAVEEYFSAKG